MNKKFEYKVVTAVCAPGAHESEVKASSKKEVEEGWELIDITHRKYTGYAPSKEEILLVFKREMTTVN